MERFAISNVVVAKDRSASARGPAHEGDHHMKIAILAVCLTATLLAACRREEAAPVYEPMKLGGDAQHQRAN
jgi:hypothetical protein